MRWAGMSNCTAWSSERKLGVEKRGWRLAPWQDNTGRRFSLIEYGVFVHNLLVLREDM